MLEHGWQSAYERSFPIASWFHWVTYRKEKRVILKKIWGGETHEGGHVGVEEGVKVEKTKKNRGMFFLFYFLSFLSYKLEVEKKRDEGHKSHFIFIVFFVENYKLTCFSFFLPTPFNLLMKWFNLFKKGSNGKPKLYCLAKKFSTKVA